MDARRRVAQAFDAVPRTVFLPESQRRYAGANQPLPIGEGQTNSQPAIVRRMLELLDVWPEQRALDVGAGSGWTTALLAHLVGATGRVYGVERLPRLVELGRRHLDAEEVAALRSRMSIVPALPGILGLPDQAPFDRILVSAAAQELPEALVAQLGSDGVMVAPVAGRVVRVRRGNGDVEVEHFDHCRFVPLVTDE
jgi:protein-L-isoaspartate(D-aspartate) O-methyltransferase